MILDTYVVHFSFVQHDKLDILQNVLVIPLLLIMYPGERQHRDCFGFGFWNTTLFVGHDQLPILIGLLVRQLTVRRPLRANMTEGSLLVECIMQKYRSTIRVRLLQLALLR